MSVYKNKIQSRIGEIETLISQLEVLNEQRTYADTLRSTVAELKRILKACNVADMNLLEEAKKRGFVKGAECITHAGTKFKCNEVIVGNVNNGSLFNSRNGFFLELIFDADTNNWAKLIK
jgi:hypothetical protein